MPERPERKEENEVGEDIKRLPGTPSVLEALEIEPYAIELRDSFRTFAAQVLANPAINGPYFEQTRFLLNLILEQAKTFSEIYKVRDGKILGYHFTQGNFLIAPCRTTNPVMAQVNKDFYTPFIFKILPVDKQEGTEIKIALCLYCIDRFLNKILVNLGFFHEGIHAMQYRECLKRRIPFPDSSPDNLKSVVLEAQAWAHIIEVLNLICENALQDMVKNLKTPIDIYKYLIEKLSLPPAFLDYPTINLQRVPEADKYTCALLEDLADGVYAYSDLINPSSLVKSYKPFTDFVKKHM